MELTEKNKLDFFARIYSIFFHPFIMPTLGVLILLYGNTFIRIIPPILKYYIIAIVVLNTILIPAFSIFMLRRFGFLSSMSLTSRKDRVLPLMVVAISYILCVYMLSSVMRIELMTRVLYAAVIAITICFVVNLYWKISLHMTAIGGMIGMLLAINMLGYGFIPLTMLFFIAFAGILAAVRLYMGRHNVYQIAAGFSTGLILTYLMIYI